MFNACQREINRVLPDIRILGNEIPVGYERLFQKPTNDIKANKSGRFHFPRIGAFEVYFRGQVIFSKLQTTRWPNPSMIPEKIQAIREQVVNERQLQQQAQTPRVGTVKRRKKRMSYKTPRTSRRNFSKSKGRQSPKFRVKVKKMNFAKSAPNFFKAQGQSASPRALVDRILTAGRPRNLYDAQMFAKQANMQVEMFEEVQGKGGERSPQQNVIQVIDNENQSQQSLRGFQMEPELPLSKQDPETVKIETQYSEKYSDDSFDKDLESSSDGGENNHPLRAPTKEYRVGLKYDSVSKKKIVYSNTTDENATFYLSSSSPEYMEVPITLTISPFERSKISLKFHKYTASPERIYYLYINKDNQPWDCIKITAEYT